MNLQDIKPGIVVWNKWQYSIMGRDTDTDSTYLLILKVLDTKDIEEDGKKYKSVTCEVRGIHESDSKTERFDEEEIRIGWLRLATKSELKQMKIEASGSLEMKIIEHKTKINVLEVKLSELDGKFKEFIDKAI